MRLAAVLLAVAFWSRDARAQLTVSGTPAELTVGAATAGAAPDAVSNSSTSYKITPLPAGNYALTAAIDSPMPAGVTLTVTLAADGTASSSGPVALTTTPNNVVTGITKKTTGNLPITYTVTATPAAGVVPVQTRVVTFTIVSTP
ncbi:MAG TPA: hypothetical protein VN613_03865 [Gemmatimonadaceae bacterium]|nr:hypothetical protein [Gemmatimonadaceae bacterium]